MHAVDAHVCIVVNYCYLFSPRLQYPGKGHRRRAYPVANSNYNIYLSILESNSYIDAYLLLNMHSLKAPWIVMEHPKVFGHERHNYTFDYLIKRGSVQFFKFVWQGTSQVV
jgi:hypothetical protein